MSYHDPFEEKDHSRTLSAASHGDDEDDFYEKLGGSLYGSSRPNVRFDASADMRPVVSPGPPSGYFEYQSYPLYPHFSTYSVPGLSASLQYKPDNYNVNLLEDAQGMDPFGDDELLFSDTGDEPQRRGTLKRAPVPDDDDFTPKLNYTKTIKRARLVHGNYVIDAPVPRALLATFAKQFGDSNETSFARYSAVTCGPSNFSRYRYSLRQALYSPARETELLVCVTMYNEDEVLLGRTLQGIFDNIADLTNRNDPTWGDSSWKKVSVVIVNDGRAQLHPRTQKLLQALGVYQDGYAKSKVNDADVRAHLYEYTTAVGIEKVTPDRVHLAVGSTPVQLTFCLKEKNLRKINSHRWCFQAFAPILQPKVVMLLDCGTKPAKLAFFHLWRAFTDPNVAGACGEMCVSLGAGKRLLGNPLVAAQNFEYKVSNVLDKPMESVFGFISVLPGAFSAYRWEALLNVDGQGPLEKYFKGEFLHELTQVDPDDDEAELKQRNFEELGIFTSNMYLAEDRILCFELLAKKGHKNVLRYVSRAKAETDAPESLDDFVLQRRRWLNGSLFAAVYLIVHWTQIWRLKHGLLRKLWLQLEFYYHLVTMLVSWFSLLCFFLVFRILTRNLGLPEVGFHLGKYISVAFLWVYVACLVCTFVLAFGNTPRGTRKFYYAVSGVFAVLMVYLLFAAVYLAVNTIKLVMRQANGHFKPQMLFSNEKFRDLIVLVLSTYILYAIGAILHGEPSFMLTSFLQYLLLSPTYVNVLNIYAFCNIHDVSWGNRDTPHVKDLGLAKTTNEELVMTVAPGLEAELEELYQNVLEELNVAPIPVPVAKLRKLQDDLYYALIRTITVLLWILTNAILVAIVLATGGKRDSTWNDYRNSTIFLTVILWIVCVLAAFRVIGSFLYVVLGIFRPLKWALRRKRATAE